METDEAVTKRRAKIEKAKAYGARQARLRAEHAAEFAAYRLTYPGITDSEIEERRIAEFYDKQEDEELNQKLANRDWKVHFTKLRTHKQQHRLRAMVIVNIMSFKRKLLQQKH